MGKVLTESEIERYELARQRIREISEDSDIKHEEFSDFFMQISGQVTYVLDLMDEMREERYFSKTIEELGEDNRLLFSQVLPEYYGERYTNPDYAEENLGIYSGVLCFTAAELTYLPQLIIDGNEFNVLVLLELFLELYSMFTDEEKLVQYLEKEKIDYLIASEDKKAVFSGVGHVIYIHEAEEGEGIFRFSPADKVLETPKVYSSLWLIKY